MGAITVGPMSRGKDYVTHTAFEMASSVESSTVQKANAPSLFKRLRRAAWLAYCFFSYSHMGPLLEKGLQNNIDELSAKEFHPSNFAAADLLDKFHSIYEPMRVPLAATINLRPLQCSLPSFQRKGPKGSSLDMGWAFIKQHRLNMSLHFVWSATEVCVR